MTSTGRISSSGQCVDGSVGLQIPVGVDRVESVPRGWTPACAKAWRAPPSARSAVRAVPYRSARRGDRVPTRMSGGRLPAGRERTRALSWRAVAAGRVRARCAGAGDVVPGAACLAAGPTRTLSGRSASLERS